MAATYLNQDERDLLYDLTKEHLEKVEEGDWDKVKEDVSKIYLILYKLTKKEDNS